MQKSARVLGPYRNGDKWRLVVLDGGSHLLDDVFGLGLRGSGDAIGTLNFWLRMICGTLTPFFTIYLFILFSFRQLSDPNVLLTNLVLLSNLVLSLTISLLADHHRFKQMGMAMRVGKLLGGTLQYWALHLAAGVMSLREYIFAPLVWHKTNHDGIIPEDETNQITVSQNLETELTPPQLHPM